MKNLEEIKKENMETILSEILKLKSSIFLMNKDFQRKNKLNQTMINGLKKKNEELEAVYKEKIEKIENEMKVQKETIEKQKDEIQSLKKTIERQYENE